MPRPVVGQCIAARYRVSAVLGNGGMGSVYRVNDESTQHALALKLMHLPEDAHTRRVLEALFEQEFRTLAELDHPRVIRVYDYGIVDAGPYYTMELLDGADLGVSTPISWQLACRVAHDVCSSLSLLHARGLIHRDVSPENIRCTGDGRAKLIDFGAMTHAGVSEKLIGTPAFAAPEAVNGSVLDSRTDIYSLGATLYFALTGRPPYAAHTFSALFSAWRVPPAHLAELLPELPPPFAALIMRMLALSPSGRPRSASEVMQHVAALAGLPHDETHDASRSYLALPKLIGRAHLLSKVRQRALRATRPERCHGSGLVMFGEAGVGRTRALEACVLETKTTGAIVLSASARTAGREPFATLQLLAAQLLEFWPQVALRAASATETHALLFEPLATPSSTARMRDLGALAVPRTQVQDALERFWLCVTQESPLVLAVDDVDRIDEASGACLAALADRARHYRLLLLMTAQGEPTDRQDALTQCCAHAVIQPLSRLHCEQLLSSLFGDVPNLSVLSERVFRVAQGSPRITLELATHLVERGVIAHDAGTWIMPNEFLDSDLPSTLDEALSSRTAALSRDAQRLAELHALSAYGSLSLNDHALVAASLDPTQPQRVRSELLSSGVLQGDRQGFSVATDAWSSVLLNGVSGERLAERHKTLAQLGQLTQRPKLSTIHHLLLAGEAESGLDSLFELLAAGRRGGEAALFAQARMPAAAIAQLFSRALDHAEQLGRRPRELAELRRWLLMMSGVTDEAYYQRVAAPWLRQLEQDSGYNDYRALPEQEDPRARIEHALRIAHERYLSTPEAERVYSVQRAIDHIAQFAVTTIAYASRTFDAHVLRSLPELLRPFKPLSPLMAAMYENAVCNCDCLLDSRGMRARKRWRELLDTFQHLTPEQLPYLELTCNGIRFGIGMVEAAIGIETAEQWATAMEDTPFQRVDALCLRRVIRLGFGDFEAAERLRREAELVAVRHGVKLMFSSYLYVELTTHALVRDLSGVRHVAGQIASFAERYPGWLKFHYLAQGQLELLRGDMQAAKHWLERGLALCAAETTDPQRSPNAWPHACGAYMRALIGSGEFAEARALGEQSLREFAALDIENTEEVQQALALAETKLGDYDSAVQRLDRLISSQRALGVVGLHLGASFEARARAAIWAKDAEGFAQFVRLTAHEYRHGHAAGLQARCERLREEAQRGGLEPPDPDAALLQVAPIALQSEPSITQIIECALEAAETPEQRAAAVLRVLCETAGVEAGHLYLVQTDASLRWVASRALSEPTERERERAARHFEHVRSRGVGATMVSSAREARVSAVKTSPSLRTPGLMREQVLLLTAATGQELRHVAVAVLNNGERTALMEAEHPILSHLGARLSKSGDVSGIAVYGKGGRA